MTYEFYRDLHKQEFDRREALSSRGNGILAGLTTLAGAMAFLAVGFKGTGSVLPPAFWALLGAAGVAVLVSGVFLFASYSAAPLNDIGGPLQWRTYLRELTQEYSAKKGKFASAEAEYEDGLIGAYSQCTEYNISINTTRGTRLVRSNLAMLMAFSLVLAAGVLYYYAASQQNETSEITKVMQLLSDHGLVCAPLGSAVNDATAPKPRPVPNPRPRPVLP